MERKEIRRVLDSFEILIDTREQDTDRARRRYSALNAPYRRATLSWGDYTYNAVLPAREAIFRDMGHVRPLCAVERKMGLSELAMCFTSERDRFRREFERAQSAGARMYIVCEDSSWESLIAGKYRSGMNPNAFLASCTTWMARYDAQIILCREESSGRIIREVLYRDLKERLERGEFDG